jgi:hypothetical protein
MTSLRVSHESLHEPVQTFRSGGCLLGFYDTTQQRENMFKSKLAEGRMHQKSDGLCCSFLIDNCQLSNVYIRPPKPFGSLFLADFEPHHSGEGTSFSNEVCSILHLVFDGLGCSFGLNGWELQTRLSFSKHFQRYISAGISSLFWDIKLMAFCT